jgi:choline dehydrogenase
MKHEDHYAGADDNDGDFAKYHAAGGEWRVDKQRLRWDILDAFAQAAEEAGIPRTRDFNRGDNEGVGYSRSTRRAACAGIPRRRFCGRLVTHDPISSCGPTAR